MGRWARVVVVVVLFGTVLGGPALATASLDERPDTGGAVDGSGATASMDSVAGQSDDRPAAALVGDASGVSDDWLVVGAFLGLLVAVVIVGVYGFGLPGSLRSSADGRNATGTIGTSRGSAPEGSNPVETATAAEQTADPEPLSDEERVVELLEATDGRRKQSDIVEETEWSKSKVSMLLSEMEEAGTISKIQVGRENIIALEGSEPEAAGSPFDESE